MITNRYNIVKSIGAVLLAFMLTLTLGASLPGKAYAAGGSATVTLGKPEGLSTETQFEFKLYKVGHYNGANLELDDAVKGANVKLDYDKDDAEGWLASARTLADYMEGTNLAAIGEHTLKPGESFTESGLADGLYLVKSNTVRDSENDLANWTPQPVFIAILGGDSSVTLNNDVVTKIVRTPVTLTHSVTKVWDIPSGLEQTAKPSEINVNIRYGGVIVDTVKLNADNNWTYTWSSEEDGDTYKYIGESGSKSFTPGDQSHKWTCDEIFTADGFKEAYGRAPGKDEAEALEKLEANFTCEVLPDSYIDKEIGDPLKNDQKVTVHKISNVYDNETPPPEPEPPGKVNTGDQTNIALWAGILAVSVIVLIVLLARRKRDR